MERERGKECLFLYHRNITNKSVYMKLRLLAIAAAAAVLASCGNCHKCNDGQRLFVGDDIAVLRNHFAHVLVAVVGVVQNIIAPLPNQRTH